METGSDRMTDTVQDVPDRQCLDETETEDEMGIESNLESGNSKQIRIVYGKEFLIECFRHPACHKKPPNVPWPNLECTIASPRLGKTPFTTVYIPRTRREENGRKEPEDNISLRPHSGNFASGCAPHLSPANFPSNNQYGRFQFHQEDPTKNPYDRGMTKNPRYMSVRHDLNERNRMDRDRERDGGGGRQEQRGGDGERERERDRDREVRGHNRQQNRRHNSVLWGSEAEGPPEWTRRRPNQQQDNKEMRNRSNYQNNNRHYSHHHDAEPEWFSGGPTSQHDTIELHGFQDDRRRDAKGKANKEPQQQQQQQNLTGAEDNANPPSPNVTEANIKEEEVRSGESKELDLSLEKILKIDHLAINSMWTNGLFEVSGDEEPKGGGSRFSYLFQRDSKTVIPKEEIQPQSPPPKSESSMGGTEISSSGGGMNLQALFGGKSDGNSSSLEGKSDYIKEMESELRQILLRSNTNEEIKEQPPTHHSNRLPSQLQMLLPQHQQPPQPQPQQQQHYHHQQQQQYHHHHQQQQQQQLPPFQALQQQHNHQHHYQQQPQQQQSQQQPLLPQQQQQQPPLPQQQQQPDMNAFKKLLEGLVNKCQTPTSGNVERMNDEDMTMAGPPPPGINALFGLGSMQSPLHNSMANPNPQMSQQQQQQQQQHPLSRFVDHSREMAILNQKRSSTPVSSFTPTSVMRKMTQNTDPQAKTSKESVFCGILPNNVLSSTQQQQEQQQQQPLPVFPSGGGGPQPNLLASFMSAMTQPHPMLQPQIPQSQQPGHVNLPNVGMFPPYRYPPYPVMVGQPNTAGMPVQYPPFIMYPPLPQRK